MSDANPRISAKLLVISLAVLSALTPLAIDMILPGFTTMEADLGMFPGSGAKTISIFLLGFTFGPFLLAPLADFYGTQRILYLGLFLFIVGGVVCAISLDEVLLLVGRLTQGIGTGVCSALPLAIVRNRFDGIEGRKILSLMTLFSSVAPIIAPVIGAVIIYYGSWRMVFWVLTMGGIFILLPLARQHEYHPVSNSTLRVIGSKIFGNYYKLSFSSVFVSYCFSNAFNFACMFAFVASSSAVFISFYGVSTTTFSLIFSCVAGGIVLGAAINSWLISQGISPQRLLAIGLVISCVSSFSLLLLCAVGVENLLLTVLLLLVNNVCTGVVRPNAIFEAMQPVAAISGSASALLRGVQMLGGAVAAFCVTLLSIYPALIVMAVVMSGSAVLSLLCFVIARSLLLKHGNNVVSVDLP